MNLKEQLYVCKLAELGSMSRAAEELFITQPALSLYMKNLEDNMGVKLFARKSNSYVLTYIGEKYVEKAKVMLKLQGEFNMELSGLSKGTIGRLRIGVQLRRSPYIIPEIVKRFKKDYSNIELSFKESNTNGLEYLLNDNQIDLIIYSCTDKKNNQDYLHIFDDNLLLAINKSNKINKMAKWKNGEERKWIDLKELTDEKFILPNKGQSTREACDALFKAEEIRPREVMEVRNIETIMRLISEDFGIGFNRISYIKHMSHIKDVVYYSVIQEKTPSELVITYPKVNNNIPNFIEMINAIKEILISTL